MTTWAEFKTELGTFLSDAGQQKYTDEVLRIATNDAIMAFAASHTGVASMSILVGDGLTSQFSQIENAIETSENSIYAILNEDTHAYLEEVDFFPGETRWQSRQGYYLWGNLINFLVPPAVGAVYKIYYIAYYNRIIDDTSVIDVPRWALSAIKYYAAATILESVAAKMALLGNFKVKTDAGVPTDNPIMDMAKLLMTRYRQILSEHPVRQFDKLQPIVLGSKH